MPSFIGTRIAAIIGAVALAAGAGLLWSSARADRAVATTTAVPAPLPAAGPAEAVPLPDVAPAAQARSKEEQRFARADRDDDGRITRDEYLHQRRQRYAKLDTNGDGRLSFEEYAVEGLARFRKADVDGNARLDAAEFATTAQKPRAAPTAQRACRCPEQSASAGD